MSSSADPLISPQRGAQFARRYRRSALMLGLAMLLLVGTAVYLVVRDRTQVWSTAHRNQEDLAVAMQSSITELLTQPIFSVQNVAADLSGRTVVSRQDRLDALRVAMRYDTLSTYLGMRTEQGLLLVDAAGEIHLSAAAARTLSFDVPAGGLRLGSLVRLPDSEIWYMPVEIPAPASLDAGGVVFALVPATRLLSNASSLRVLPGSFVTVFTTDGRRLIRYRTEEGVLEANGKPVPEVVLKICAATPSGSFARASTVDGRPTIFGYSNSAVLPLIASTGVPETALEAQWRSLAMGPLMVLSVGVLAVLVFGLRLRRALLQQRDHMDRQEYMLRHDFLTDLPNRYAFSAFVDGLIGRALVGESFHVLLLDLNNFKDINDTLGHAAGDTVLKTLGARLKTLVEGRGACVARLGGDEIAICVPDLPADSNEAGNEAGAVTRLCEEIQAALNTPMIIHGVELAVTASIGVAAHPADARTSTELLRCADIAMYRAKQDLASHREYEETLDHFTPEALAMRAEFAKAIRDETLTLVYQPKLRLTDGALVGLEVLSRWTHPTKGPIPPVSFLPLAETTELIHPFTELVLRKAIGQVARWRAIGHEMPVAVNISANNLLEQHFADTVRTLLADADVPPQLLELEVTESAVMRYPELMLKRLHDIRAIGVRLSIDDFGTGYASLAYLKRLPVDTLKIDRMFVTHLDTDEGDRRIVRSSIQLAHGFGMTVVAEGVETQVAADLLKRKGCDQVQGFHFARPLSVAEIEAHWLARLPRRELEIAADGVADGR